MFTTCTVTIWSVRMCQSLCSGSLDKPRLTACCHHMLQICMVAHCAATWLFGDDCVHHVSPSLWHEGIIPHCSINQSVCHLHDVSAISEINFLSLCLSACQEMSFNDWLWSKGIHRSFSFCFVPFHPEWSLSFAMDTWLGTDSVTFHLLQFLVHLL